MKRRQNVKLDGKSEKKPTYISMSELLPMTLSVRILAQISQHGT